LIAAASAAATAIFLPGAAAVRLCYVLLAVVLDLFFEYRLEKY
jgi:hypothetical protein